MKISVIIPTYCPGEYLFECIDSLINQSFDKKEYEILLVLNGLKLPYEEEINSYLSNINDGPLVRFFYSEIRGVSNARNFGLDNASGEYICFVDDDDIVSDNYLDELYNASSRYIVGLSNIYSFYKDPSEKGNDFYVSDYIKNKDHIENSDIIGFRHYIPFSSAKLFHRDIIGNRRFDTRFTNGEDGLFSRLISDGYKHLKCTSETASYYVRMRKGSASRKKLKLSKIMKDTVLIWSTLIRYYLSNPKGYSLHLYLVSFFGVLRNDIVLLKNK